MNTTRRIFSKWFAAAPAVLGAGFATSRSASSPMPMPAQIPRDSALISDYVRGVVEPVGLKDYWKAQDAVRRSRMYLDLLGTTRREVTQYGMPPSIDCLRSVSRVHKGHMMVQWAMKRREEERTFSQRLMDQFGVRDWFEKQNHPSAEAGNAGGY